MNDPIVSKTILIIDDDPRSVRLMTMVLGHAGYRVLSASNADDGLVVLDRERPDLVMVDLLMPGTDGIGFCDQARAMPGLGTLPLVLFTAMANSENLTVQDVPVATLQERLRKEGQVVDFIPGEKEKCTELNGPPEF